MKRLTRLFAIMLVISLFAGTMPVGASAAGNRLATNVATVDASALRLRSAPSTSSSTLDYAPKGDYVVIFGKSGSWYHVSYNLTDGYMHESYLTTSTRKNVVPFTSSQPVCLLPSESK